MSESRPKRKPRSASKLKKNLKNKRIEFDDYGVAIGEYASKFNTECEIFTRKRISIIIPSWKDVHEIELNQLWLAIKAEWKIETDTNKHGVLKKCGDCFRSFKKRLIRDYVNEQKDPFEKVKVIDSDTWREFVKMKTSAEFKELSQKNREIQKKNTHPAHLGTTGYRGLREKQNLSEYQSYPEVLEITSERTKHWILARMKPTEDGTKMVPGDLVPTVQQMIEKDKELSQMHVPGLEAITEVLGPEHPGRTRGVGSTIGLKKALGGIKEKKQQGNDKIEDKIEKLVERKLEKRLKELHASSSSSNKSRPMIIHWIRFSCPPDAKYCCHTDPKKKFAQQEWFIQKRMIMSYYTLFLYLRIT